MQSPPLELVACPDPDCLLPAEVVDRAMVASTDGPVPWLATLCPRGHRFCGVTEVA